MTQHRGLFVALDGSSNGTLPVDARLALAGLLATTGASAISVQQGVFYDGKGAVVVGTATTGTMTYQIRAACFALTLLGTFASGPVLACNDGAITVNTTNAPGSNSRIDVIWVRQTATATDGGADATNTFIVGVTQGTPAASPTVPAIPTGAMALAQAVVTAGTTHTDTTAITQVHGWTSASGAPIAVRNTTERAALTPFDGMDVYRLDTHNHETYDAAAAAWLRDGAQLPQQDLTHQPRRILTRTATFSLADSVQTAVGTWTADTGDDGNSTGLSLSGTVLTALYAGVYEVDMSMDFATNATGVRRTILLKNGAVGPPATGTIIAQDSVAASSAGIVTSNLRAQIVLAANDTLQFGVLQTSGGALTCGSTTPSIVRWAVRRVDDA